MAVGSDAFWKDVNQSKMLSPKALCSFVSASSGAASVPSLMPASPPTFLMLAAIIVSACVNSTMVRGVRYVLFIFVIYYLKTLPNLPVRGGLISSP